MKIIFLSLILCPYLALATSLDVQGVIFKPGHPLPGKCLAQSIEDSNLGMEHLTKTLEIMQAYPELNFEIVGHADTEECRIDECDQLSTRRADLVARFFTEAGVAPSRLGEPHGVGVNLPFGIPGSPSNRSVEVNITN